MPREVGPSLNERQFFLQALKEEVRIDNRGFGDFRAIQLEFGDEYGVSDVRIGKTRYVLKAFSIMKLARCVIGANWFSVYQSHHVPSKQLALVPRNAYLSKCNTNVNFVESSQI